MRFNEIQGSKHNNFLVQLVSSTMQFCIFLFLFFGLCTKFDNRGKSLPKQFEHNSNIRSNLYISSPLRNQTNTKRSRNIFYNLADLVLNTFMTVGEF